MTTLEDRQFSRLDFGFARFMGERCKLNGQEKMRFEELLLQLSAQQAAGHSCISLGSNDEALARASGLCSSDRVAPLIIDRQRLYLHRYWRYETRLAEQLTLIARQSFHKKNDELLNRYFPPRDTGIDWQKQAAQHAMTHGLTIISGGPGTGKTTTVVKILALLLETAEQPPHVALAAPTGKAAMRLRESLAANKDALPCAQVIKDRIPEKVTTIHRLLGPMPPTPYFNHRASNPLPHDLVVTDESSMIDLALMSKLVDALKPGARLILLGDKDQLASVESGAVLADLTQSLPARTVELLKTHRFQGNIQTLAAAVNQQQAELAWQILNKGDHEASLLNSDPIDLTVESYSEYLDLVANGADFHSIITAFDRFRVLCANRSGPNSVSDINSRVTQQLAARNQLKIGGPWYPGRPVIVTANNPDLRIFNGDIGVCLSDEENGGQLRVCFLSGDGGIKKIQPASLTDCETAYAMTIHKSQGSEFEKALIMLPNRINPILGKELLYTAITRAKTQVKIATDQSVFMACVARKIQRQSGLAERIINLQANTSL